MNPLIRKLLTLAAIHIGFFLSVRYLLPLIFPFLFGTALALAAEPIVRFGCRKLHLPRPVASGIGVSMSFAFLAIAVLFLAALLVRELRTLSGILPNLESSIRGGMESMSQAPYALPKARFGYRMNAPKGSLIDCMITDALWDAFNDYHMIKTADNICEEWGIT